MKEEKPDKEIASQNGKKRVLGSGDQIRLFFDTNEKNEQFTTLPTWRQLRKQSFRICQMNEEIANNIITDSNLSQSYGNPDYYPQVPMISSHTNDKQENESMDGLKFAKDSMEINNYHLDLHRIKKINPKIFPNTTTSHIGFIESHGADTSIPSSIVLKICFHVSLILDPDNHTTDLINIYVLRDLISITKLISFLDSINVRNHDDFIRIRVQLCTLLISMLNT